MKEIAAGLLALALVSAHAQRTIEYEEWIFGTEDSGMPYIATVNDSENVLGKWCDGELEKCFWMIAIKLGCSEGAEFPALVSAPQGAVSTTLSCSGPKHIGQSLYHRYVIHDFDLMTKIVSAGSGRVGIVVATEGDEFRVNRFSLRGGTSATARMLRAESEYTKTKQHRTTRERRL
jgi:hypothetical protein